MAMSKSVNDHGLEPDVVMAFARWLTDGETRAVLAYIQSRWSPQV